MLLCAALYVTMGVCGYLLLGDKATADALADLSVSNGYAAVPVEVSIARLCVAVKVHTYLATHLLRLDVFSIFWAS